MKASLMVKNLPAMCETWVQCLGWEDALEEGWQSTPVFLPGKSLWTEKPGRLQSVGSQRVGHGWATKHSKIIYQCIDFGKVNEEWGADLVINVTISCIHTFLPKRGAKDKSHLRNKYLSRTTASFSFFQFWWITMHFQICHELNQIPTENSMLNIWSQFEGIPRWF